MSKGDFYSTYIYLVYCLELPQGPQLVNIFLARWVLFIPSFLGDICFPLITNHQPVAWCYATSPGCFPFQVHEALVWLLIGDQTADGRKSGRTNTQNLPLLKSDLLHLTWSAGFFPSTVRGNKANEASEDDQENVHKIGPM